MSNCKICNVILGEYSGTGRPKKYCKECGKKVSNERARIYQQERKNAQEKTINAPGD